MSLIVKTDTHFEKILASFLEDGSVELSEFEMEMKKRIKTAFSSLLENPSRERAVSLLRQQFKISQATAYRDIAAAIKIFGDITKAGKEGMRYIIMEHNAWLLEQAKSEKNLEQVGRALDRMIKLADLDKEENKVNLEKLAAMDIEVRISKRSEKAVQDMLEKGVVDLNNLEVQDIEFEEIPENGEEETGNS